MSDLDDNTPEHPPIIPRDSRLQRFISLCEGIEVSDDPSVIHSYQENVTGYERRILAVAWPTSTSEVVTSVKAARDTSLPLYPISTGKNWGLGSKLPVTDDNIVLDLGRMATIREFDDKRGYAVVEPGVTQQLLFNHIGAEDSPYVLNVTGSGADTSIIGNAMERGVGYFRSRTEEIAGLEVVLGTGEVLRTGFGHCENPLLQHMFAPGVGPDLTGLFFESNFGIVTAAGIKLMPRQESEAAFLCLLEREEDFPSLVDRLHDLRRRNVISTAVHIGNRERIWITMGPAIWLRLRDKEKSDEAATRVTETVLRKALNHPWTVMGGIMGSHQQVEESLAVLTEELCDIAMIWPLTPGRIKLLKKVSWLPALICKKIEYQRMVLTLSENLYKLATGCPSNSAVSSVYWPTLDYPALKPPSNAADPNRWPEANPDATRSGVIYFAPIIPMDGASARKAVDMVKEQFGPEFPAHITLNLLNDNCLEGVINLGFDRDDPDQKALAHQRIRATYEAFVSAGFMPYRSDVEHMDTIMKEDDLFWQVVKRLKKVMDPDGVIAPGRYGLKD